MVKLMNIKTCDAQKQMETIEELGTWLLHLQ